MRILVTFALENEFAPWRSLRKFRRAKWDACRCVSHGDWRRPNVNVLLTGVGSRQAALAMSKISWGEPDTVEFCVSAGLGRSVAVRNIRLGRFSWRERWWRSELLKEAMAGYLKAVRRWFLLPRIAAQLLRGSLLQRRARDFARGRKASIWARARMPWRWKAFQCFRSARANGVPGVAIRSISDSADEDLPLDMNEVFTDTGVREHSAGAGTGGLAASGNSRTW